MKDTLDFKFPGAFALSRNTLHCQLARAHWSVLPAGAGLGSVWLITCLLWGSKR